MSDEQKAFERHLRLRGIKTPCPRCHGLGRHVYSSGATWRGGMGTTAPEWDVCDECWGSGDADQPFEDRRALEREWHEQMRQATLDSWIAPAVGARDEAAWVIRETVLFLESLGRRRKNRPTAIASIYVRALIATLKRLGGESV